MIIPKVNLHLDWCSHEAALYAVEQWHYSGTLPRGKLSKVSVWEDDTFIGCVVFSMGASPHLHTRFGIGKMEVCELTRVALTNHQTPVSRIVTIAVKLLKKLCPGLRLIVSFSDPHYGHHGGIYQAMNWKYVGKSGAANYYVDRKGKTWHARNIGKEECYGGDSWGTRKHSSEGMRVEKRPGKHRYCYAIDENLKDQIDSMALEYPK